MLHLVLALLGLCFICWYVGPFMKESGRALKRLREIRELKSRE